MRNERTPWARDVTEGHRERLRTRMTREGWDALKPYEMVEAVLYHAVPRQDVEGIARRLLNRFGSVGGVFAAPREALRTVPGVTASMAEWLALTGELMRAYRDVNGMGEVRLGCYQDVLDFLAPRQALRDGARVWTLYADFNYSLITYTEDFGNGAWWEAENARRMVVDGIGSGARYVYLVLWMGDAPLFMSDEDIARLESIANTLRAVDLDLVDCVLVGNDQIHSMNLKKKMERIRAESGCMALHERYGEELGIRNEE